MANPSRPESRLVFAHSACDGVFVFLTLAQLALIITCATVFDRMGALNLPLAILLIYLDNLNYQCIAHNFLHNPFFRSRIINYGFGILNSLSLGIPQDLYKAHHLNHHKYGNDMKDEVDGHTKDRSSMYSYSKRNGEPENIIRYALLSPFRANLAPLYADVKKLKLAGRVWTEAAFLIIFGAVLFAINWRFFFLFYLPVWYAGTAAGYAQNYLEHNNALPGNRLTDSASCYNPLYNLLMFNEGYHQEHHFRPQVHWTRVRALRAQMLPERQRRVVAGAIWFNF